MRRRVLTLRSRAACAKPAVGRAAGGGRAYSSVWGPSKVQNYKMRGCYIEAMSVNSLTAAGQAPRR